VIGVAPLWVSWLLGWSFHRELAGLLLFFPFLALVATDRPGMASALVFTAFACHSGLAMLLAKGFPTQTALVLTDGAPYCAANLQWIQTGVDPERSPSVWLLVQLQEAAGMAIWATSSLGLVPLVRGFYQIDLMNFFVGRLLAASENGLIAILVGWHPWAILRGIGYVRLAFAAVSASLGYFLGRSLAPPGLVWKRWALAGGLLLGDVLLKFATLDWVRETLFFNLI
jgi:hypothetical protein